MLSNVQNILSALFEVASIFFNSFIIDRCLYVLVYFKFFIETNLKIKMINK